MYPSNWTIDVKERWGQLAPHHFLYIDPSFVCVYCDDSTPILSLNILQNIETPHQSQKIQAIANMSMYIPIQQDDRPAHTKALACEEGFRKLLVVVGKANTLKEPSGEIKEYHETFTLWAHRLRVFSDSMVSLDSRLEDYPGGPGVVSANLDLLEMSLNKCE